MTARKESTIPLKDANARAAPPSIARRVFSLPSIISLAVVLALLVFLRFRFGAELAAVWVELRAANPFYLALAVAVHYSAFLFRGLRWRLLLNNVRPEGEARPGLWHCSQLIMLGWFANSVSFFRLGDAYRAYLYHDDRGASFSRTMGTILSERVLDTAIIILLLAAALPFLAGSNPEVSGQLAAISGALLAAMGLLLLMLRKTQGRRLPAWLAGRYRQFQAGTLGSFRRVPLATAWGLLGWLAEVARIYLVTLALDIDLSGPLVVIATLANSILTLVPTPGGLGAVELGLTGLLNQLSDLSIAAIAALVLLDRSITYLSVIVVGGVLFLARWIARLRRKELPAAGTDD